MGSDTDILVFADAAWCDGRALRHDVAVVVRNGTIAEVLPGAAIGQAVRDSSRTYEFQLLLPGLINAHCHLEYTHLRGQLPRGAVDFGRWIESIGAAKRATTPEEFAQSARNGAAELLAGGCTTVVDTVTCPGVPSVLCQGPLRYFLFCEVLGLLEEATERTFQAAEEHMCLVPDNGGASSRRLHGVGLNPHAPYSVGGLLRQRLRDHMGRNPDVVCAWHLGETPAEVELFEKGTGPLADFLSRNRLPTPFDTLPGCDPMTFLERESLLDRCDMAFHLNHFPRERAGFFAAPRAVVHCPSTHAYFARAPFPMMELLRAGANVCLATDSLASSDTLSMLEIIRITAREFPNLTAPQLLEMVTRNPARTRVLAGSDAPLGVIAPGAAADFAALSSPGPLPRWRPLHDVLLDPETTVSATLIAGRLERTGEAITNYEL